MPYLCFVWPLNAHILQVTVTGAYIKSFCCFTMHRGKGTDHKYCNCFDAHLFQDGLWYCSAPAHVQINIICSNHSYSLLMVMNTQACSRYTSHAEMYYYLYTPNKYTHDAHSNVRIYKHAHTFACIHSPTSPLTHTKHTQTALLFTHIHSWS